MKERRLREIQSALQNEKDEKLDGWLFYDFRGSDLLAYRILGLDPKEISTRRWYYFIPAVGEPVGIAVQRLTYHSLSRFKQLGTEH